METQIKRGRGRPPITDYRMLREAAFEQFLLRGYDNINILDITNSCGVSRTTFFNYFGQKSDVFWYEIDEALLVLPELFAEVSDVEDPLYAVAAALGKLVADWNSSDVPWVLTQFEVIGSPSSVLGSAAYRLANLQTQIHGFFINRAHDNGDSIQLQVAAASCAAAIGVAAAAWAVAGPEREHLSHYIAEALTPLKTGLSAIIR